ncbi:MAG: rhodanese-like domain-containing protein [Cytophagales bacterium]|nr:rhodanese-like domain-containing protein [Armatimonadota bacterium]
MRQTNETSCRTLTSDEVMAKLAAGEEIFIVDVREPRPFLARHIPDAIHLPADDFADRYTRELDADDAVILVCEHGRNSEAAVKFLLSQGFTNVASLQGGMNAWNGPTEGRAPGA